MIIFDTIFFGLIGLFGYIAACLVAGAIFAMIVNLVLILLEESFNLVWDVSALILRLSFGLWVFTFFGMWRAN